METLFAGFGLFTIFSEIGPRASVSMDPWFQRMRLFGGCRYLPSVPIRELRLDLDGPQYILCLVLRFLSWQNSE